MVGKNYPLVFFAALLILAACTPGASSSTYSGQPTPTFADSISKPELAPEGSQQPDSTCVPSDTKTCSIHYVLSDLYDDEHVMRTSPYFERAGYTLQVASDTLDVIHGFHECYGHTPANPDMLLDDVDVTNYDAIFFAGGEAYSVVFRNNPAAHRIAQEALERGVVVAAIGHGPVILAHAGVLDGKTVTVLHDYGWDGLTDEWIREIEKYGAIYSEESPVRDGLLVTANTASAKVAWGIIAVIEAQ